MSSLVKLKINKKEKMGKEVDIDYYVLCITYLIPIVNDG